MAAGGRGNRSPAHDPGDALPAPWPPGASASCSLRVSPRLKQGDQGRWVRSALEGQGPSTTRLPPSRDAGYGPDTAHWETLGKTPTRQQSPREEETRIGPRGPTPMTHTSTHGYHRSSSASQGFIWGERKVYSGNKKLGTLAHWMVSEFPALLLYQRGAGPKHVLVPKAPSA